jgi:hypothetical protein
VRRGGDRDSETLWRSFGVAGLLALGGSHAAFVRLVAVVLVVMVVSTALPPLLRRAAGLLARPEADAFGHRPPALTLGGLADEVAQAAERLDAARSPADAHREAAALRELVARVRG